MHEEVQTELFQSGLLPGRKDFFLLQIYIFDF